MNALWLSLGTLTRLPVVTPKRIDREVAGWSMALAPFSGALLGAVVVAGWTLGKILFPGLSPFLAAVLIVAAIAWLTRGMHLDGLADVVDGLGSGKPADEALAIMKRSDIGPFGVVALVVVLLVQVGALSQVLMGFGDTGTSLVLLAALGCSRGLLVLLGTSPYRPAREGGLGSTVAQSVTVPKLAVGLLLLVVLIAGLGCLGAQEGLTTQGLLWLCACGPLGILAGLMRAITAQDRLGGVTGDVYGASIETAFTCALLVAALGSAL